MSASLQFFNSLSRTKEPFQPLEADTVRMYNCGPTVYDYVHIGNLRSFLLADLIRRTLEANGYTVKQVMNITDVGHLTSDADDGDDKMTRGLEREGLPKTVDGMRELAERYTNAFVRHASMMNFKKPTYLPRATEHIAEDLDLIKMLMDKEVAYTTSDGIYFDTSAIEEYGKLGGVSTEHGASRIEHNPEKRNPQDFALWKFNEAMGFASPWGQGFPGWHIECSGMSWRYLGETIDIHTGGIDNLSIHHNNEIAQSETAHGKPFVKYWLHGEHVHVATGKMSKSEGTGLTLETLVERGYDPLTYRYWLLTAHYRSTITFSFEALDAAQTARGRLISAYRSLGSDLGFVDSGYQERFMAAINNDLDFPKALTLVWELIKDTSIEPENKKATLAWMDTVLGIDIDTPEREIPPIVAELATKRKAARAGGDFAMSDKLRDQIRSHGFDVEDTPDGQRIF